MRECHQDVKSRMLILWLFGRGRIVETWMYRRGIGFVDLKVDGHNYFGPWLGRVKLNIVR